jgi:hypothetical protein
VRLIATSVHMTINTLLPIQRTRGGMTLSSSTSFSRMACHEGHSLDHAKKGKKMHNTPELLICVFPVDIASYNNEAIEVIQPKKDQLVVLFCVESHYNVCEVILKDRVMKISDGLDKPLQKWFHQAKYVLKKME